ncbi:hypothetical protein D3C87_1322630 [compost metagenome]
MAACLAQDRVDVILFPIVDDHVGPQASCELEVGIAYGREYPGAHRLRDLDRDMADAARPAVDQDAFSHAQRRTRAQRFPHRSANEAQACRFEVAQGRRLLPDDVLGCNVVFGIASGAVEDLRGVPDFVAGGEGRHAGADGFDDARDVVAGNGGQRHQVGVVTAPDLIVQGIDRGGLDPDQDLSRLRRGLGYVPKCERVRAAECFQYQCFHCVSPACFDKKGYREISI